MKGRSFNSHDILLNSLRQSIHLVLACKRQQNLVIVFLSMMTKTHNNAQKLARCNCAATDKTLFNI